MTSKPRFRTPETGNCCHCPALRLSLKRMRAGMQTSKTQEKATLPAGAIASAFAHALDLAQQWQGATAPNPPVGCVLLGVDGEILASAAHQRAGHPHAEVLAVAQSRMNGSVARIHTIIVTLEPCNHQGRTPPCTGVVLQTPARHVWIGVRDPNPRVAGGGAQHLQDAGLTVHDLAELDTENAEGLRNRAARLLAPFIKQARTGQPWVTLKQAISREGGMAPPAGQKTFTGPAALDLAHQLRKRADAVLTGSGTVLADAPDFTVRRVPDFDGKHRHLVILDRRGRVPPAYIEAAQSRGFLVSVETDIATALTRLGAAGCLEVLVEAGAELTQSILSGEHWDEHVLIRQPADPSAADLVTIRTRSTTTSN